MKDRREEERLGKKASDKTKHVVLDENVLLVSRNMGDIGTRDCTYLTFLHLDFLHLF